jgi:hypothetical protein
MTAEPLTEPAEPRVIGAVPAGVTVAVAAAIVQGLHDQLSRDGRSVTVKAVRFIPSSRTEMKNGSLQMVANTVFEVTPDAGAKTRVEAFESVVTVGGAGPTQRLESLSIPALRHPAF